MPFAGLWVAVIDIALPLTAPDTHILRVETVSEDGLEHRVRLVAENVGGGVCDLGERLEGFWIQVIHRVRGADIRNQVPRAGLLRPLEDDLLGGTAEI